MSATHHEFCKYMVKHKIISEKVVDIIKKEKIINSIIAYLVENKLAEPERLAKATAEYYRLPYLDMKNYDMSKIPPEHNKPEFFKKYHALPLLKTNEQLTTAVYDPCVLSLSDLQFQIGLSVKIIIISYDYFYHMLHQIESNSLKQSLNALMIKTDQHNKSNITHTDITDAPIVKLIDKILLEACNLAISDIHIEPQIKQFRVRYRRDGLLYTSMELPMHLFNNVVARLKVMANLDTSERFIPQDGRIQFQYAAHKKIDFRINICPTLIGEKIVLRLLQSNTDIVTTDKLGMNKIQRELFINALDQSQGTILVSGPTGSGKTMTLYSGLHTINSEEKNIMCVENPVEIYIHGANQVQTKDKQGLTFAKTLRALLRQDPDVILVGEIRDDETADTAIKAALTGHLVLTTVHSQTASDSIIRLLNMNVAQYNLSSAISLIINQRLVRKLCEHCKQPASFNRQLIPWLSKLTRIDGYIAKGCEKCHQGYSGRTGIFEMIPINGEIKRRLSAKNPTSNISQWMQHQDIPTLMDAACAKLQAGITSPDEINRVISWNS